MNTKKIRAAVISLEKALVTSDRRMIGHLVDEATNSLSNVREQKKLVLSSGERLYQWTDCEDQSCDPMKHPLCWKCEVCNEVHSSGCQASVCIKKDRNKLRMATEDDVKAIFVYNEDGKIDMTDGWTIEAATIKEWRFAGATRPCWKYINKDPKADVVLIPLYRSGSWTTMVLSENPVISDITGEPECSGCEAARNDSETLCQLCGMPVVAI